MATNPNTFTVRPVGEMETANKYAATASDFGLDDGPKTSEKKTRIKQIDKLSKLVNVILSLARVEGYDVLGRVKAKSGRYVANSSLIDLLLHAMSFGKALIGEREFINLLYEAGVTPDLLINENVKQQLSSLYQSKAYKTTAQKEHRPDDDAIITQTSARNALSSAPDDDMPFLDGPYNPRPMMKRKRRPDAEPESEENDQDDQQPPAKKVAPAVVPEFSPKITNSVVKDWIYPVNTVHGTESPQPRPRAAAISQKKRQDAFSARRGLVADGDADADADKDIYEDPEDEPN